MNANAIVTEDGYILERINSRVLLFSRIDGELIGNYGKKYLDAYYDMLSKDHNLTDEDKIWLMSNLLTTVTENQKSVILMEDRLRDKTIASSTDSDVQQNYETSTYYFYYREGQVQDEMLTLSNLITQLGHDINHCSIVKLVDGKYIKITTGVCVKKTPQSFQRRLRSIFRH